MNVNVAFAGLTAAGKTTHAKLLAEALGYRYVSATEILLNILEIDHDPERVWFERSKEIAAARQGDEADEELERRLLAMTVSETSVVFDTWAIAWLSDAPLVRIWIESDLPSRARKCFVSQETPILSLGECQKLADSKDEWTRASFLRRHGFDLRVDRHRYDQIVDNTHLIPQATFECAGAGIKEFHPVVVDAFHAVCQIKNYEGLNSMDHELGDIEP